MVDAGLTLRLLQHYSGTTPSKKIPSKNSTSLPLSSYYTGNVILILKNRYWLCKYEYLPPVFGCLSCSSRLFPAYSFVVAFYIVITSKYENMSFEHLLWGLQQKTLGHAAKIAWNEHPDAVYRLYQQLISILKIPGLAFTFSLFMWHFKMATFYPPANAPGGVRPLPKGNSYAPDSTYTLQGRRRYFGLTAFINPARQQTSVKKIGPAPLPTGQHRYTFVNKSLREVCDLAARLYKVSIIIDDPALANTHYSGCMNKRQSLEKFLDNLRTTGTIDYYKDTKGILHVCKKGSRPLMH